ncbi:hypothetical protein D3C78_1782100 [compost metagenome]
MLYRVLRGETEIAPELMITLLFIPKHEVQFIEPVMRKSDAMVLRQHGFELQRRSTPGIVHEPTTAYDQR